MFSYTHKLPCFIYYQIRDLLSLDSSDDLTIKDIMSRAIDQSLTAEEKVKLSNAPSVIDNLRRIIQREKSKKYVPERVIEVRG